MSEIRVLSPPNALTVALVDPGSPASRAGVLPGDLLRSVNGHPILDILDYQFHSAESRLRVEIERDGAERTLVLRVPEGATPGLTFQHDLGDKIHTCNNKCVFCFIHQMPKKMRKTLYLMDDDFRLSFMHGNYVTLTNLTDSEWQRILEQRLSPLYVSVHATDPALRAKLLGRKEPAPILPQLRELADNRIDVHAQIVLCPGLNDGDALHETIHALAEAHPAVSGKRCGVRSVAVVPVGLTRFRERLPSLASADRDYADQMIADVDLIARALKKRLDTRFVWLSDEWYFLAEEDVPPSGHYEDFPQLEDGIGTIRLFLDELKRLEPRLPKSVERRVEAILVTSELPAAHVARLADTLNKITGVSVEVCVVQNDFFGGGINIAGLLTAADIIRTLEADPRAATVYLPSICLRDNSLFLDDLTLDDVRRITGRNIVSVEPSPVALAAAMGLVKAENGSGRSGGWKMEAPA